MVYPGDKGAKNMKYFVILILIFLISCKPELTEQDKAFFQAYYDKDYETVRQITPKVNVNVCDSENGSITPLNVAVDICDTVVVTMFIKNGADVNANNIQGETPLGIAADQRILNQMLKSAKIESEKVYLDQANKSYENKRYISAARYYEKILYLYPESEFCSTALYQLGYIYKNHFNEWDKSKEYYSRFIATYPDHKLVESAKTELEILNKWEKYMKKVKRNFTEVNRIVDGKMVLENGSVYDWEKKLDKLDDKSRRRIQLYRHYSDAQDMLDHCYRKAFRLNTRLKKVNMLVEIVIDSEGKVKEAGILESTIRHAWLEACIISSIKRWRFGKLQEKDGDQIVTKLLVLKQRPRTL